LVTLVSCDYKEINQNILDCGFLKCMVQDYMSHKMNSAMLQVLNELILIITCQHSCPPLTQALYNDLKLLDQF